MRYSTHFNNNNFRFHSLDLLRGIAALAVVLWHWQHFFYPFNLQGLAFVAKKQPIYKTLYLFYDFGHLAVPLFFSLSGFIFFWLYSTSISENKISFKLFSVLRLSRLYPLHLFTLIIVALVQYYYFSLTKTYFVYPFHDNYHLFLNLTFSSAWGLEKGFSFNGPIWSVSIEILLYGLFFIFCRKFSKNFGAMIFAILIGQFILPYYNSLIGKGIEGFFMGGLAYIIFEKYKNYFHNVINLKILSVLTLICWLATILLTNPMYRDFYIYQSWLLIKLIHAWPTYILFPLTIFCLALIDRKGVAFSRKISFIGDISYSVYLIHFPLQLLTATILFKGRINQEILFSPYFMIIFFAILLYLSFISYKFLEIPLQKKIRNFFIRQNNS